MALMQRPVEEERAEEDSKIIRVIEKVQIPVQTAAKRFYAENPREFLHWITTSILLIGTILVALIRPGAWFFYFMVAVYIFCQSPLASTGYGIIKKISKRKK